MAVRLPANELVEPLATAIKVIGNPDRPILQNVRMAVSPKGIVSIQAFNPKDDLNFEAQISTVTNGRPPTGQKLPPTGVAVPSAIFSRYLRTLPKATALTLSLDRDETGELLALAHDKGGATIRLAEVGLLPKLEKRSAPVARVRTKAGELLRALTITQSVIPKNDMRAFLKGVYIVPGADLSLCASDGHSLTLTPWAGKVHGPIGKPDFKKWSSIIPQAFVAILLPMLKKQPPESQVHLTMNDDGLGCGFGNYTIRTKWQDGTFPDVARLFPKGKPSMSFVVPRLRLRDAAHDVVRAFPTSLSPDVFLILRHNVDRLRLHGKAGEMKTGDLIVNRDIPVTSAEALPNGYADPAYNPHYLRRAADTVTTPFLHCQVYGMGASGTAGTVDYSSTMLYLRGINKPNEKPADDADKWLIMGVRTTETIAPPHAPS